MEPMRQLRSVRKELENAWVGNLLIGFGSGGGKHVGPHTSNVKHLPQLATVSGVDLFPCPWYIKQTVVSLTNHVGLQVHPTK